MMFLTLRRLILAAAFISLVSSKLDEDFLFQSLSKRQEERKVQRELSATGQANVEGTSGKLFEGNVVNKYNGATLFKQLSTQQLDAMQKNAKDHIKEVKSLSCELWGVVTTINSPTPAVERQANQQGWCLVVVGDKKGPFSYKITGVHANRTIFLDVAKQEDFIASHPIGKLLPWNHFGRKNIGFLFAIMHGAVAVFDFDDDNALISKKTAIHVPGHSSNSNLFAQHDSSTIYHAQEPLNYNSSVLNPYPVLGSNNDPAWPRGYPLMLIKSTYHGHSNALPVQKVALPVDAIGVVQYLANHDPDVDAIYRLTQHLPLDFPIRGHLPIVIPEKSIDGNLVFCPYNAQATLIMLKSFWSLLLPVTVHGRVSDIWRSYFAQRLMSDIGQRLIFHPPIIVQYRNSHNYLADFDSEGPLYLESGKLVEQLNQWHSCAATLPGRMEDLWIMLYEHGYIGKEDVSLVQAWLSALVETKYAFPPIKVTHSSCEK